MIEEISIEVIRQYFQDHGYTPVLIDAHSLPQGMKSPDIEVKEGGEVVFYCEVKTPVLKEHEKAELFHWTTSHSKLRALIHKAVIQLHSYDPEHAKPWVVAFNSDNFQLNWKNFEECLHGAEESETLLIKDLGDQQFILDTNKDMKEVDLFLWNQIDPAENKMYQSVQFINPESNLMEEVKIIGKRLMPYKDEEIQSGTS